MKKSIVRGMVIVSLLVPSVAACSGGGGGDYCGIIKDADKDPALKGSKMDAASLDKTIETIKKVEAAAPSEVKGDWANFRKALEAVKNKDTKGVNPATFQSSLTKISKNVKDKCNVDMGLGS